MSIENIYLESVIKRFKEYKELADKSFARLKDDDFHFAPNEASNSIAVIIQHMHGNMMSRWTNFLSEDGEKDWRKRDDEFEIHDFTQQQLINKWEEGWKCLFGALESITDDDLNKIIYIRNEGHTILEAINRQLAHYPYHVGQMIYIAKMLQNENWQSLSIPRNKSNDYNADKFSQDKGIRHFTDSELKK